MPAAPPSPQSSYSFYSTSYSSPPALLPCHLYHGRWPPNSSYWVLQWLLEMSPETGSWYPVWRVPLIAMVVLLSVLLAVLLFLAMVAWYVGFNVRGATVLRVAVTLDSLTVDRVPRCDFAILAIQTW